MSRTKGVRTHMDRVAALGCAICGAAPELHHLREGRGMAQRSGDFLVVPLCRLHHQGDMGIHTLGREGFARMHRRDELQLLNDTLAAIYG